MDYTQNEWLYGILCEYGFDEAVNAFKENIAKLGFESQLASNVETEIGMLGKTTVNRDEYVKGRVALCEKTMRDMYAEATDVWRRDRYYIGNVIYIYVLAETVKAALLERASAQTQPTAAEQQSENDEPQREYSAELVNLFRGHTGLIDELVGLSDDEIARRIKGWARQRDKFGNAMIENPRNSLRSKYARELKNAGIIHCAEKSFRARL